MWTEFIDDCRSMGLLPAVFMRLVMVILVVGFLPIWLPICLISEFNDWTKTWFGGEVDD